MKINIKNKIKWEIKTLIYKAYMKNALIIYRKDPLSFYHGRIELLKIKHRETRGSKYLRDLERCRRIVKSIWQEIYYQKECFYALKEYFEIKKLKKSWQEERAKNG